MKTVSSGNYTNFSPIFFLLFSYLSFWTIYLLVFGINYSSEIKWKYSMPSAPLCVRFCVCVRNGKSCEAKMNDIRALNESNSFVAPADQRQLFDRVVMTLCSSAKCNHAVDPQSNCEMMHSTAASSACTQQQFIVCGFRSLF